jgi:hypothetical protein
VHRVAIIGPVASGKTTLARRLGSRLGLPVFDLDDYYWRRAPRPSPDDWAATHQGLIGGDRWIIAGDYRAVAEARFLAADVVVWLDLGRPTCLYRVTVRRFRGNPTPLLRSWRWIWRYPGHGRHETSASLSSPRLSCRIWRLRSSADVRAFLEEIENCGGLSSGGKAEGEGSPPLPAE